MQKTFVRSGRRALALLMGTLLLLSTMLLIAPYTAVAATQVVSLVSKGDNWLYYGVRQTELYADALTMDVTEGWRDVKTPVGYGGTTSTLATVLANSPSPTERYTPDSKNWPGCYFKKTFTLPADFSAATIVDISGKHWIDDALEILVNGVSVYRYNTNGEEWRVSMTQVIDYTRYSTANIDAAEVPFAINGDYAEHKTGVKTKGDYIAVDAASQTALLEALKPGVNVITCVTLQNGETSSDMRFDLELKLTVDTAAAPPPTVVHTLVGNGATWLYYGDNQATFLADALDMSKTEGWRSAPTPAGYGGNTAELSTLLTNTVAHDQRWGAENTNWPAAYFKRSFTLPDDFDVYTLADVSGKHWIDDGLEILINGVSVYRYNSAQEEWRVSMTQPIDYSGTYGAGNIDQVAVPFNINSDYNETRTGVPIPSKGDYIPVHAASLSNLKSALKPGENVITCVTFQNSPTSSDMRFNLELKLTTGAYVAPPEIEAPSFLAMTVGADESQRNFAWYGKSSNPGSVQVALKADMAGSAFPTTRQTFAATRVAASMEGFGSFKATATGLLPNTEYVYRVGSPDSLSEVYTFKTGDTGKSFSFLLAGDPQVGSSNLISDTVGWKRSLDKALDWFPNVRFVVTAGDQVETGHVDPMFEAFLSPDALRSLPFAPTQGNHDGYDVNFKLHYNLPNHGTLAGDTAAGSDYWYAYNGALFMSLNADNISTAVHKQFMQGAIAAFKAQYGGDPTWKVVTFHHSIYSVAGHANEPDVITRRAELPLVFNELGIDVALMGHDHVYTRAYVMNGTAPITTGYTASEKDPYAAYTKSTGGGETFYLTVNSSSGSKFYGILNQSFPYVAKQNQENTPNITKIDVSEHAMTFTTYRTGASNTVSDVVDTFTFRQGDAPAVSTASLADAKAGTAYTQTLEAAGTAPMTWSVTAGALPAGLTLDANTGVIGGTPTADGSFNLTVTATNALGSGNKAFTLLVRPQFEAPTVTTAVLAAATEGTACSRQLSAQGDDPITWSITGGALPTGLTLDAASGVISGTPTVGGSFTFTVTATNNVGSDSKTLSLKVGALSAGGTVAIKGKNVVEVARNSKVQFEIGEGIPEAGWKLSNTVAASVSANGLVTVSKAAQGSLTLTATAQDGTKYTVLLIVK